MQLVQKAIDLFFICLEPFGVVPGIHLRVVEHSVITLSKRIIKILLILFCTLELVLIYFSDYSKGTDFYSWLWFRLVFSALMIFLMFSLRFVKSRLNMSIFIIISTTIIMSLFFYQSNMNYPLREKWITLPVTFLLVAAGQSIFLNIAILFTPFLFIGSLWGQEINYRYFFSDYLFSFVILVVATAIWQIIIRYKVQELEKIVLEQKNLNQYISLTDTIKSLIPPVLVDRLNERISNSQSPARALDEILERRYSFVSVLYSDLRNYSERSDNKIFLEQEVLVSSGKILDISEKYNGVGRQIGDNVMVYYDHSDPQDTVFYSFISATKSIFEERKRISSLGRQEQERHFVLCAGMAFTGNMGSIKHKDCSITGKPINLAARLDELTKTDFVRSLLNDEPTLLCSKDYINILLELVPLEVKNINLKEFGLKGVRSYPEELEIYLIVFTKENLKIVQDWKLLNEIKEDLW